MNKRFPRCEVAGLAERPAWWKVRCDEIEAGVKRIKNGTVEEIAKSSLGMPVFAVSYGGRRATPGTATWAIGSNSRNMGSCKTDESGAQVVMLVCGVHGAEAEAVAGAMNLVALLETGADLRGRPRPGLLELIKDYRLVILPCVNMDGRSVSPDHLRGASAEDFVRASQGVWNDGRLVGYPGCKEYAPLPLDKVQHPGGYPNGQGYNIMHDCAPGDIRTAEARGLLKLVADEQADLVLHMHSHQIGGLTLGAPIMAYPLHVERSNVYKIRVHDALAKAGLRPAPPYPVEQRTGVNLASACAQASGGLSIVFEQSAMADWTFDEMLETFYVGIETFLEWGRKEPFSPRLAVARGKTS
jgi:hypothetical protein